MSFIKLSLDVLSKTLNGKNKDYAGNNGEFYNFEKAAEFADITVIDVINAQIAIKLTRIQNLKTGQATYESVKDSYLDLAGYAVIAHAMLSDEFDPPVLEGGHLYNVNCDCEGCNH